MGRLFSLFTKKNLSHNRNDMSNKQVIFYIKSFYYKIQSKPR
ncbi:hypothetical protein AsAng_0035240 [Aureispira anguillae]|uniref:Uncharacterized protein n=1 Tax=Aureispira anguillae TaxID=2864201 RepID=A0A915YGX2_9BACT|nr:hypothetical protein AsAng_0035240 [Aureispira anguillae]